MMKCVNKQSASVRFRWVGWIVLAIALGGGGGAANGQTARTWATAVSDNFAVSTRWTPNGKPTGADSGTFGVAGTYTVTLTANESFGVLSMSAGTVTFSSAAARTMSIASYNQTSSGTDVVLDSFVTLASSGIATMNTVGGTLTLSGGDLITNSLQISAGTMFVDGLTSALTVNGTSNFGGQNLSGIVTLSNGATADLVNTNLAPAGSGDSSIGTINVLSGSDVTCAGNFAVGNVTDLDRQGIILVSGSGSSVTQTGAHSITLGRTLANPPASETPTDDSRIEVRGGGLFSTGTGAITLNENGRIEVGSGGTFLANGVMSLNAGSRTNLVAGGTLGLTSLVDNGGAFAWSGGELTALSSQTFSASALQFLLGPDPRITSSRSLKSSAGATLTLSGGLVIDGGQLGGDGSITNSGTLDIRSGTASVGAALTNSSTGVMFVRDTQVSANSITNSGDLTLDSVVARVAAGTITNSARITGQGRVDGSTTNTSTGSITATAGNRLVFSSNSSNAGILSISNGGSLQWGGSSTNTSTGLIAIHDGTFSTTVALTNAGAIAFTAGDGEVFGDLTQAIGGKITVSGGGSATFWDDVTIAGGAASPQVSAVGGVVSRAVFFGSYNGGSTGGGAVFIEGDHRPGNSPGLVTFGGDLSYSPSSHVTAELAGPARGGQYDAIDAAGVIYLQGALQLSILGSYDPAIAVKHNILHASSVLGIFTPVAPVHLSPMKFLAVTYDSNDVFVTATLPGDSDVDGDVDFDDLLTLAQNYNGFDIKIWQTGDFTGNGAVNFDDLLLLAQNYGISLLGNDVVQGDASTFPESFAADFALARSLVPEPAGLGVITLFAGTRRRHR